MNEGARMGNKIIWSLLILLISFTACGKSSENNVARQANLSSTPLVISDIHTIVDKDPEPLKNDEDYQNVITQIMSERDELKSDNASLANLNEVFANEADRITNENKELASQNVTLISEKEALKAEITLLKNQRDNLIIARDQLKEQ
jgi:hypothetical protein